MYTLQYWENPVGNINLIAGSRNTPNANNQLTRFKRPNAAIVEMTAKQVKLIPDLI